MKSPDNIKMNQSGWILGILEDDFSCPKDVFLTQLILRHKLPRQFTRRNLSNNCMTSCKKKVDIDASCLLVSRADYTDKAAYY